MSDKLIPMDCALLMAAGMGTRIRPLSQQTPKPLIPVNGVPMIESQISAIRRSGVGHIFVTVGYEKERYRYLADKYGDIEFIENPEYQTKNTISSFRAAIGRIRGSNCIVAESDLCVRDPSIYPKGVDKSRYFIRATAPQDYEWAFSLEGGERIRGIVRPEKGVYLDHHMYGVAFWLKEDLDKICDAVLDAYTREGHGRLAYDEAVNPLYADAVDAGVIRVPDGAIYEVDCIEDLARIDGSYEKYLLAREEVRE